MRRIFPLSLFLCMFFRGPAQVKNFADTLTLNLQDAEKIFFERNLSLLAARYHVDANKALVEQARLWDNPVLVTDQNIYANQKWFAHGKDANGNLEGQVFIQVQQLIRTAGKRGKLINLATTNAHLSELQFQDLMRNLKYQLRSDFFTLNQLWQTHQVYGKELLSMTKLLSGMEQQFHAGNIAQKDYLRIQALVLSLEQDIAANDRQFSDVHTEFKTLLQITGDTALLPKTQPWTSDPSAWQVDSMVRAAKETNSAYLIQQSQLIFQQQNLSYQQALRSPDIMLGPSYDHNSNYTPNYVGLSVSLPLPVFNRNQGNIKSAQMSIKEQEALLQQQTQILENNIRGDFSKLMITYRLSSNTEKEFYANYDKLFSNMMESYQQRQLGLLEFIDFFDAYKDTHFKMLQQELNLELAREELNFEIGADMIK